MLETKETHINQPTNQSMLLLQMLQKNKQTNQPTLASQLVKPGVFSIWVKMHWKKGARLPVKAQGFFVES